MACAGNGSTGCTVQGGTTVSPMDNCGGGPDDTNCFAPIPSVTTSSSPGSGSSGPSVRPCNSKANLEQGCRAVMPGPTAPGGTPSFLAGLGGSIVNLVQAAECANLSFTNSLCTGIGGPSISDRYKSWLSSLGIDTSSGSTYTGGEWAGVVLQMGFGGSSARPRRTRVRAPTLP